MLQQTLSLGRNNTRHLSVGLATSPSEIRDAQKLRYRVFAEEMGARLNPRTPGVDQDYFDPWCEHLIVRDEHEGRIVGTYRILSPEASRAVGSYYADSEFDLTRLQHLRNRLVEVGRSCVDEQYRSGAVIALLWSGLARYMITRGYEYLMGCASIAMTDGGHNARAIYDQLVAQGDTALAPLEYRVFPRHAFELARIAPHAPAIVPPLIKGYLRAGAWVCGEPAWDPDFNTADLLMLLPMSRIEPRYARHFVSE